MTKPNFFVAGGARCGTTSFVHYLSQHPDIYMAPEKETHYFSADELPERFGEPERSGIRRLEDRIIRDERHYLQLFDGVRNESAIGEASVFYVYYPMTPARIAREVPDAKVIILLRNPVDRAYSAYKMLTRDGRETRPFEESLALEPERRRRGYEPIWFYTEVSRYAQQIARYLTIFGRDHVRVILTEELSVDTEHTLRNMFRFLGVNADVQVDSSWRTNAGGIPKSRLTRVIQDVMFSPNAVVRGMKALVPAQARTRWGSDLMTASLERTSLSPELRVRLWEEFADDVASLEQLLERKLDAWDISSPRFAHTPPTPNP